MVSRGSTAWIVAIVCILGFVTGAIVYTATDPVMQTVFGSALWSSSTTDGQNALAWQKAMWLFVPVAILLVLLVEIQVGTRNKQ